MTPSSTTSNAAHRTPPSGGGSDLLLELFSEEIPARMQEDAVLHLQNALAGALQKEGFAVKAEQLQSFVTPRRLAVILEGLPAAQSSSETEVKGPKTNAPEAALQGFLKKNNLKQSDLTERDGVYFAILRKEGRHTAEVLKDIIENILAAFPWPKSMRWGSNEVTWVRPLHNILCIFDGKIVPVEFAGIKANDKTYGHRFLSPQAITVKNAGDYEAALEKARVIADREKRKADILKQAENAAAAKGLSLKKDEALLEEVTGLVEWPVALVGSIDAQFMDLPPEVLSTVMRKHQKYFSLQDKAGKLAPHFLIVANMETKDGGKAIVAGNERVLRARFSDARFFWDQDRKKKLDEWAAGLKDVTFHAKLGTVADKVERVKALSLVILSAAKGLTPSRDDIERAAALCKADLVTGMVGEFAELQGIMGRYYALQQKEDAAVADAIRDHYKPQGPGDSVPTAPVSACVALADKLDTLVSMFAIGEKPTGSKDPFALRRAALGVIRIILENNLRLSLKSCFGAPGKAIALHKAHEKLVQKTEARLHDAHKIGKYLTINETAYEDVEHAVPADLDAMLYDFFIDRLKVQLKDSGIRHDVINAVVANGDDDLVRIVARAKAVQNFMATDDGINLLAGYKRAAKIVADEEKKDKVVYSGSDLVDTALQEQEETALRFAYTPQKNEELLLWEKNEQYSDSMKWLATLRKPVDQFFDKIMVNCEQPELRANRLRLLAGIRDMMNRVADFSLIEGDGKEQKKAA